VRIAVLGPTFPYKGGIAQHTTELAWQLAGTGHEVTLLSWSAQFPGWLYPGQQRIAEPEGRAFPGTTYPLSWWRPDSWWSTGARLRAADLIVVVVTLPQQVPAWLALVRAAGPRPRTVAICHNVRPHEARPGDLPLMRALVRRMGLIVVHTEEQSGQARSLGASHVRVAALPPHLCAVPAKRAEHSTGTLLFFGVVRPYKGLAVLLDAMARCPVRWRLVVAGEFWTEVASIRGRLERLGIADRVELRPGYVPVSEVGSLFAEADALVLPYLSATGSVVPLVAYEHGVPVIATRLPALAATIRDGVDGLLVDPGNADELANALQRLGDPELRRELRRNLPDVDRTRLWDPYVQALCRPTEGTGMPELARRPASGALTGRVVNFVGHRVHAARAREVGLLFRWLGRDLRGTRLLDVAGGDGYWAGQAARRGATAVCLDLAAHKLRRGLRLPRPPGLVLGDALRLPFPNGSFDSVMSVCAIEHFPDGAQALAEVARVLRPGGALVMSADALTHAARWPELDAAHREKYAVLHSYSLERLTGLLAGVGLTVQQSRHQFRGRFGERTYLTLSRKRLWWNAAAPLAPLLAVTDRVTRAEGGSLVLLRAVKDAAAC